jgi:hypothetical protein
MLVGTEASSITSDVGREPVDVVEALEEDELEVLLAVELGLTSIYAIAATTMSTTMTTATIAREIALRLLYNA